MATRKTGKQRIKPSSKKTFGKRERVPVSIIFWVIFFIILIVSIFTLIPLVRRAQDDFAINRRNVREQPQEPAVIEQIEPERTETVQPPRQERVDETRLPDPPPENIPETRPDLPEPGETENIPVLPVQPAVQPPALPPAETRDRAVYFMQLDADGNILHPVRVNRNLRVSPSPLRDSLEALLAGPTAEEQRRGLESFVPQRSRILDVEIRGNTARINFNEEFQYNILGREGSAAQIRQIVWTATEFPNVQNVQILIEGERIDFLSEGINIANPIGRQ